MTDRLSVDVEALHAAGFKLSEWSGLANQVAERMRQATEQYADAGGTGEMGKAFDEHYKPGEQKALDFLEILQKEIGGMADRTLGTARNFEDTDDDAGDAVPNP